MHLKYYAWFYFVPIYLTDDDEYCARVEWLEPVLNGVLLLHNSWVAVRKFFNSDYRDTTVFWITGEI